MRQKIDHNAHEAQYDQWQQSANEKAHNKQHNNIKVDRRNKNDKITTENHWRDMKGEKSTVKNRITNLVHEPDPQILAIGTILGE